MARITAFSQQLWTDVETTGIDPEKGHLLEVAWMVRDHYGLGTGSGLKSRLVIPDFIRMDMSATPLEMFDHMVENLEAVVLKMHTETGLLAELRAIVETGDVALMKKHSIAVVAEEIFADLLAGEAALAAAKKPEWWTFENTHSIEKKNQSLILAGNSVHFDRSWLLEHVPRESGLWWMLNISHQVLDISVLTAQWNMMSRCWDKEGKPTYPEVSVPSDLQPHRAQYDIARAYESWKYYCVHGIGQPPSATQH